MKIWWIKYLIITSSAILIVTGIAAFFMPEELALLAGTAEGSTIFIQLYGAALIGFGFANWHVRHAAVGGIYGRALVTGNVIHFLSGSGILIGLAAGGQTNSSVVILCSIYLLMAVAFIAILFSGGIVKNE